MTDMPTDEQLDAAADEVVDEPPVEEAPLEEVAEEEHADAEEVHEEDLIQEGEEEEIPDEPEEHGERTKMGRRMSALEKNFEEQMEELKSTIESFTRGFQAAQPHTPPVETPAYEYDPYDEMPSTKGEFMQFYNEMRMAEETQAAAERTQYEHGYNTKFNELMSATEQGEEIHAEMMSNYNIRYSNDPTVDAEINFQKAKGALLERRLEALESKAGEKKVNLRGGTPKGSPTAQATSPSKTSKVTLDPEAAEFVKSQGLSDEEVQKALKGDMPLHLVQGITH